MDLLLSFLAAIGAAFGMAGAAPVPAWAQEPADSPPVTFTEWRRSLPLERVEAAALAERIRAAQTPLPDDLVQVLAYLSADLTRDPPGLRYAWGEDRRPDPPCEPAACAVLIEELEGGDPPLDAFVFAVRWALDPVRWSDSLLVRSDTASPMLEHAIGIVRAAVEPDGRSPDALPGPGASWREWLDWPRSFSSDRGTRYAIQLAHALRGRDVPAEISRGYRNAVHDSARLAFGVRAVQLGVADVSIEETLIDLESSSPVIRQLGLRKARKLRGVATPADERRARELQNRFLAVLLDSAAPWPSHPLNDRERPVLRPREAPIRARQVALVTDNLEAAVAEAWEADPRLTLLPGAAVDSIRSIRAVSFIRLEPVVGVGPLVWVEASVGETGPPEPGPGPGVTMRYSQTFYRLTLLRGDEGWRVLAGMAIVSN